MLGQVVLSKYKVIRELDKGGMSDLYLARDQENNREVVVKVLQPALANARSRDHFRREILIMSRFQHPHAVSFVDADFGHSQGPILVMEYLRGIDLNLLLHRTGRFNPDRAGRILAQLCDVLNAAHEAGIVHRDLKPGNLMILYPGTPQETVKLMDFGLAKMASMLYIAPGEVSDNTLPAAAGTPEYICPEQVRTGDMDGRGDLYSVGVILFEMLTGKRPFEHPGIRELMLAHLEEAPPTFAEFGLDELVPLAVENVVRACLAKHPEARPQSALELARGYEKGLGKRIHITQSPATLTPQVSAPAPSKQVSALGKQAPAPTRAVPVLGKAGSPPRGTLLGGSLQNTPVPNRPATPVSAPAPTHASNRNAFQQSVEATMLEAMALIKLKGFIFDLGGEVVESVPGMIRVRLPDPPTEPARKSGLFGWGRSTPTVQTCTEMELHMERRDPGQPGKLTITLVLTPEGNLPPAGWQDRCRIIGRDFQAYLMGR